MLNISALIGLLRFLYFSNKKFIYLFDYSNQSKAIKEIEADQEDKINKEFEIQHLTSAIKTQSVDKEKKEKEYEAYRETVEREMFALNNKDQTYEK